MATRSYLKGHEIEWFEGRWVYSDNKQPSINENGEYIERECARCGMESTVEGHDACLGTLPGVENACCGHGIEDEAYVQFSQLQGKAALDWIKPHRGKRC